MANYTYRHMSKGEFSRALDDTGMTLGQFCRLTGADYDEVQGEWLVETKPIPHHIRLLFALWALPGGLSIARQLTDAVLTKSEDFNTEAKRIYGSGKDAKAAVEVEVVKKRLADKMPPPGALR